MEQRKGEIMNNDKPIISLEQWDAATVEQRNAWIAEKCRMRKGDIRILQERRREQMLEDRRIAFDMSYMGSREFQEDMGS